MKRNDYNNIPEEMSFDEGALNDISNQGMRGYQPGMYQQGGYQPGAYQPGMYQNQAPRPAPVPAPNAAQNYYQNAGYPQNARAPQRVPQRVPQPAPVPQRVSNRASQSYYDQNSYADNTRYDDKAAKKRAKKEEKKRLKKEQKLEEKRRAKQEAKDARREKRNAKPANFILRLIGGILFIIQLILTIITGFLTIKSGMLPIKYILIALGILVFFVILNLCLLKGGFPRKKFNVGLVMTILTCAGLAAVIYYVYGGLSTLASITGITVESTEYAIYVRVDDPAEDFSDVANYSFGTSFAMESNDPDDIIKKVKKEIGREPDTMDFPDMMSQIDGLLYGTTDAMIMSKANLDTIAELEGYTDVYDRVREIGSFSITTVIRTASESEKDANDTFAIFISGIDTEGDVNARSRSDVNIIAIVNPNTRQILLVSTPRDYYVTLYGLPDGGSSSMKDKLTHAGNFGIDCSAATLGELYDVDIDYYFRVNFTGFRQIIDALGGVTVYSDYNFSYGGYNFVQGENANLSGDAALCFARERHSFADGDRQRGRNQMAVIEAVIHKMTSPALLRNYQETMKGIEGSCTTSMPDDLLSALVSAQLDDGGDWDVQKYSVTGTGNSCTTYSIRNQAVYVMEPDMATVEQAREYINAMYNDEVIHVEQ